MVVAALLLTGCQGAGTATQTASIAAMPASQPGGAVGVMPQSSSIADGAGTPAPSGFTAFCRRDPVHCRDGDDERAVLALDDPTWKKLWQVNQAWNIAIKPEEDAPHYGRADYWTIPRDGYGDCEDFALGKRQSLIDLGFPGRALRVAIARAPDGVAHAVLDVVTDHGDYILDNLDSAVQPWSAAHYTWIARQGPRPADWTAIGSPQADGQTVSVSRIVP